MNVKKLMLLALCLIGMLGGLIAQENPALPSENKDAREKPKTSESEYEKFPECRVYWVNTKLDMNFKETYEKIDDLSPVRAFYDKDGTKFNLQQVKVGKDISYNMIVWDGYINIKTAKTYTFSFFWKVPGIGNMGRTTIGCIGLQVNDKNLLIDNQGKFNSGKTLQGQFDVDLKAGMNRLRFCVLSGWNINEVHPSHAVICYMPRNKIADPREFKPMELLHKVEDEDW